MASIKFTEEKVGDLGQLYNGDSLPLLDLSQLKKVMLWLCVFAKQLVVYKIGYFYETNMYILLQVRK